MADESNEPAERGDGGEEEEGSTTLEAISAQGPEPGDEPDASSPHSSPPSPHVPDSEDAVMEGANEDEESVTGPVMADSAPPDGDWSEDDSVESPPGRSMLDGILANLARRWHKDAPPHSSSPERGGEG